MEVYGHVRSAHCHLSRMPDERRNIPFAEQYTPHPENPDNSKAVILEIQMGRIRNGGNMRYEFEQRREQYIELRGIFGHIAKNHPEGKTNDIILPIRICQRSKSKIHIRGEICPNRPKNNTRYMKRHSSPKSPTGK